MKRRRKSRGKLSPELPLFDGILPPAEYPADTRPKPRRPRCKPTAEESRLGDALKREAIERVEANADEEWKEEAMRAAHAVCLGFPAFSTDEIWEEMGPGFVTHDPRAMGAITRAAASEGWCVKTYQTHMSRRSVCHKRPLTVWRSLLFVPALGDGE